MSYTNATTEPKTINVKELTEHLKSLSRVPYGFFVSPDIWDGLRDRLPAGDAVLGAPMMIDPSLGKERFDIAFSRESFDKRAKEIRDSQGVSRS